MHIDQQSDQASLAAYGAEAVRLLLSGEIETVASQFGYACAHQRHPAAAIHEDLRRCLAEINATSLVASIEPPTVKYFEPNDAKLLALVECHVVADNGRRVLVELVVAGDDAEKYLTLEDISAA